MCSPMWCPNGRFIIVLESLSSLRIQFVLGTVVVELGVHDLHMVGLCRCRFHRLGGKVSLQTYGNVVTY